jgi:hypothetical protein
MLVFYSQVFGAIFSTFTGTKNALKQKLRLRAACRHGSSLSARGRRGPSGQQVFDVVQPGLQLSLR